MNEFTSRNYFYIEQPLQSKIASAKLVLLGAGLSSTLAEVMVRTGFTQFMVCDGDKVEKSNLNRQNFVAADIGESKVYATERRMKSINPDLSCILWAERLETLDQISQHLDEADIIINTIDCGPLYFELIEVYRKKGKLVLCPFNPGFGGLLVAFTSDSSSAFDFFETDQPIDDFDVARCLLKKTYGNISALAGKQNHVFLEDVTERGYFSQLAIAGAMTASIATTIAVQNLNGQDILVSPQFYYVPSNHTITERKGYEY